MSESQNAEHRDRGKSLRQTNPRSGHADWSPKPDRADPVALIEGQNEDRVPWLVPIRRARMVATPFTFFRGAARIMAGDLDSVSSPELEVQLCGDAHLSNFGVYASPERRLVFDLNDFDETLPGPFEWDVKRLAASFAIAAEDRGWDDGQGRKLAMEATRSYRASTTRFAAQRWIDTWYNQIPFEDLIELARTEGASKKQVKRGKRFARKAKSKDHLQAARKLVEQEGGHYRLKSAPPLLVPLRDVPTEVQPDEIRRIVDAAFENYRTSIGDHVNHLLGRYQLVDVAMKVVGVGSVGTRCMVGLFIGRGASDVMLLQIKEASKSVLEDHLPPSRYGHSGRRVVEGQRLLQATSDIFLGWSESAVSRRYFYWRQLKDWKGSVDVEALSPGALRRYAKLCGLILARAHAVSGDPAAISGYLGKGTVFDEAIGEFSIAYARQNRADHAAFAAAIRDGHLEAADMEE
ncbi:MAG: DUF2252 domain-containing protein [bacterium]|nr:DUF2252 domain-containing protein [bacterium]